jgi:hypothetical protein
MGLRRLVRSGFFPGGTPDFNAKKRRAENVFAQLAV